MYFPLARELRGYEYDSAKTDNYDGRQVGNRFITYPIFM